MNTLYDQIALALHTQLKAAGPVEDHECALVAEGVERCVKVLSSLFAARDQMQQVLGGNSEFDAERFVRLAETGAGV